MLLRVAWRAVAFDVTGQQCLCTIEGVLVDDGLLQARPDFVAMDGPLKVTLTGSDPAGGLTVSTVVRNTGARAGSETAQLYLNFPSAPGAPRVALRGFRRLQLKPHESALITFHLTPRDLSIVTPAGVHTVARGTYRISVGSGQPSRLVASQSARFQMNKELALAK